MFKYTPKKISLSLFHSLSKHIEDVQKEDIPDNTDNWIEMISKNILEYIVLEGDKYNKKNSYKHVLLRKEHLYKALFKALQKYSEISSKKIDN